MVISPFAYLSPLIGVTTPFVTGMGPPCGQLEHKNPNKVTSRLLREKTTMIDV